MLVVAELWEIDDLLLFRVGKLLHLWGHVGMGNAEPILDIMIALAKPAFFLNNQDGSKGCQWVCQF